MQGAIIVGIATTTIISWIPGHAASYLGPNSILPGESILPGYYKSFHVQPLLNNGFEMPIYIKGIKL